MKSKEVYKNGIFVAFQEEIYFVLCRIDHFTVVDLAP